MGIYNAAQGVSMNPTNASAGINGRAVIGGSKFYGGTAGGSTQIAYAGGGQNLGAMNASPSTANLPAGAVYSGPFANVDSFAVVLGIIGSLVLARFLIDRAGLETSYPHIGPLWAITTGLGAVAGVAIFKLAFNFYPIPGFYQVANFI